MAAVRTILTALVVLLVVSGCSGRGKDSAAVGDATAPPLPDAPPDGALIVGRVTNESGLPLDHARVGLGSGSLQTETDSGGRFVLNGVAPGEHILIAERLGYQPSSKKVQAKAGVTAQVDFVLPSLEADTTDTAFRHYEGFLSLNYAAAGSSGRPTNFVDSRDKSVFSTSLTPWTKEIVSALVFANSGTVNCEKLQIEPTLDQTQAERFAGASPVVAQLALSKEAAVLKQLVSAPSGPLTSPEVDVCYEQRFDLYVTQFLNGTAPPGYTGIPT